MTDVRSHEGLDPDVVGRLRELSRAQAASTSPWPGVDRAVARDRRVRMLAASGVAVVCAVSAWLLVPAIPAPGDAPALGGSSTSSSATVPRTTVADYFDPPQPFPGPTWTRYGEPVDGQINSIAGPDHCEWQSAVMMHVSWPLGTRAATSEQVRQFIRDPEGAISPDLQEQFGTAELPADAADTGYRLEDLQLWLAPSDETGAYLVSAGDVERWPQADEVIACA